ncbi:nicotine blue oxidoreductase [Arthrobacter sp. ISL-30]|uniref:nicotine blue oxidoreductase n=1 Tax=Arthrobacter sp. ISL-30 TaxID=2819109 RepID=UPI001BE95D4E|nr:nucleotidyltransferase family protein [Arthrobacter sp. ISL-30]MBT2512489.1 nucleotidyltransferase family protein [Arthrobacter sp. ISL-30]
MTTSTIGVLLAAGAGIRLGLGPKALLPFRGRTLVEVLADTLLDGGCKEVEVVIGAEAERVLSSTDLHAHRVIENPEWASGMASSFSAGVEAAAGSDVLVALVDQPGLTAEAVRRIISAHRPGRITAAAYSRPDGAVRRGHPVLFDGRLAAEAAMTAEGDTGARRFLEEHPELIDLVDCPSFPGALPGDADVDTPSELHLLKEGEPGQGDLRQLGAS